MMRYYYFLFAVLAAVRVRTYFNADTNQLAMAAWLLLLFAGRCLLRLVAAATHCTRRWLQPNPQLLAELTLTTDAQAGRVGHEAAKP